MGTAPERQNKMPACPFCSREMRQFRSNKRWHFFRCEQDGYWTARDSDGRWPSYQYSDAVDFQRGQDCEWSTIVAQTRPIMRHKFDLAGMEKGQLLDIGCSEGTYLAGSAELAWDTTGVEIDDAKVSRAQSRGLDVRNLSLPSEADSLPRADFVMLRHVLEHVPDFVEFARSAAAAVVPGGVLWLECPNQGGLAVRLRRYSVTEEQYLGALYPPTHVHAFEPKVFRLLGEQIGLKCERIITYAAYDPDWCPPYQSPASGLFTGGLHKLAAMLGYGSDVAVIYRQKA